MLNNDLKQIIANNFHVTTQDLAYIIYTSGPKIPLCLISVIIYFTGDRLDILQMYKFTQDIHQYNIKLICVHHDTHQIEGIGLTLGMIFWRAPNEDKHGFERLHLAWPIQKNTEFSHKSNNRRTWDNKYRFELILHDEKNIYDNLCITS